MDERSFRGLFHAAVGEEAIPPDLDATARRALTRQIDRRPARFFEILAAAAAVLIVAAIVGYNVLSHRPAGRPAPVPAASPAVPTAAPSAAPSPAGAIQPCVGSDLSAALGGTQGAAGHVIQTFILSNPTTQACTISGYPTAQNYAADGSPIPTPVVGRGGQLSNTPPPTTFTLAPGGKAKFQISYGDVPVGSETCVTPKTGDLGLPGEAPGAWHLFWQRSDKLCNAGELDVTAIAPVS